jgi:Tfp pilus assembly protein PilW
MSIFLLNLNTIKGSSMIYLLIALMLATLIVMVAGLIVTAKGGAVREKYSNTLMQWRVGLQGLALVAFIIFMLYFKK